MARTEALVFGVMTVLARMELFAVYFNPANENARRFVGPAGGFERE